MNRTREENAADAAHEDSQPKTKAITIAAMLGELIETHMQKCDEAFEHEDDRVPHVISEVHGTSADIQTVGNENLGAVQLLYIELDDGTAFNIRVEEA